jgi:NADPH-dependent glutamate synthase beta subunit-like oxidoreductase/glutamate synthase domain-containing protein 3/ferredoxin
MAFKIKSAEGNNRLSSQELLQQVYQAMEQGETEFEIEACGQHNIGGPLWADNPLRFSLTNPGQRVGSMAMEGTTVEVNGCASADAGWLNAGGEIIIKGDSGDTTAHCAASGNIYVGGRVGTRSGSLMKHDPAYDAPQFWVLKNTGSFSFEFMGGGIAVVCGLDSEDFQSVLGDRACVGMVGGVVYFRGKAEGIATETTRIMPLDEADEKFLTENLPVFLHKIEKQDCISELNDMSRWQKVVAKSYEERKKKIRRKTINEFRQQDWVPGGIFGDIYEDDMKIAALVNRGDLRLRIPQWLNAMFASPCEAGCPAGIPSHTRFNFLRQGQYEEAYQLILEYTPFPGSVCGSVCPNPCMADCSRCAVDKAINVGRLGKKSANLSIVPAVKESGHRVAVVGAGVGGLTAAWILRLRGHGVTVFERENNIGGKLVNAVSRERLNSESLETEIERIKNIGIEFKLGENINTSKLESLKREYDYVILASGAYKAKMPPWEGSNLVKPYLPFLRDVNLGKKTDIGKQVVVIGCGNSGMDIIFGAYACGAEKVTAIDIQRPAAFTDEITHAQKLGAEIRWPAFTDKISPDGVHLKDGSIIKADTVFVAIGEAPELEQLVPDAAEERGYLKTDQNYHLSENIYAIGDITRLGILVDAIGAARQVALNISAKLNNEAFAPKPRIRIPAQRLSLGYFSAVDTTDFDSAPEEDYQRCISCGTCRDCEMCLLSCPEHAITRVVNEKEGTFEYISDPALCIGCGVCQGVCPCGIWTMQG